MKNYSSVRIVSKEFTWSGVIHQVQINVTGLNTSRWAHSKRLLYGSMLCLSNDNFNTMLFATVSKREPEQLKKGRIDIRFIEEQDVLGIERRDCVYQMVESPAYFEAYRYVLKGLKGLDETTLPFKKYLVECSKEVDPPEYLRRDDTEEPVCYDLSKALHDEDASIANATAVPVLEPGAWPSAKALPLNSSQLEALRTAITTEFSVIQGPPGTGKTYVGAKIVRCLLENRTAWDPLQNSPMLMVCYTNHALDQFLEKVLEFLPSEEIIRVGGRSKSGKLEACNLKNFAFQYRLHEKRKEVRKRMTQNNTEMETYKDHLVEVDKKFLEFKDLEELLNSAHADQLYNAKFPPEVPNECRTPHNTFMLWLCDDKLVSSCNQSGNAITYEQTDKSPGGSILEEIAAYEDDEASFDATLLGALQDTNENKTNKPLKSTTQDPFVAEDVINKAVVTGRKLNEDFERHELENSYYNALPRSSSLQQRGSSLENRPSYSPFRANLDVESERDSVHFETMRLKEVTDGSKITERPQTEKGLRGQSLDKISNIDEGSIVKEHQRSIQGDEDLLLAIPVQTKDLKSQVEHRSVSIRENNDGWTTLSRNKFSLFSWQESEGNHSKEESKEAQLLSNENKDEGTTIKSSKKTKKKRKKKNKDHNEDPQINITGDFASLNEDLVNEEIVFTEEAIGLDEIWSLKPRKDFSKKELSGKRVDELNEADKETIAIEREIDFIQYQRCIHGDEDLLLAISEQTDYLERQEQDQSAINEESNDGLTTFSYKKKGNPFFWKNKEETKGAQTRKELSDESVHEISKLDGETIVQQYQRRTQRDEDLLLAMSEQEGDLMSQAEDQRMSIEENDHGWITLCKKKLGPFFWQESKRNHSKEESKEAQLLSNENKDEVATIKLSKRMKKKKKTKNREHNENPPINIAGDIASLNKDLVNKKTMFTDEAIGLDEIGSLETRKEFAKKELNGETVDELNEDKKETTAIEKDADLTQCQRCIQGDDDLLLSMSEQTDYTISQEQDRSGVREEKDDEWTTVCRKKKGKGKGKTFFWQENEESKGVQASNKTKKKKEKNKSKSIKNTDDITSLRQALKGKDMMTTDEVMGVDNIWNLSQSDRLRLYLFWVENYRERYRVEIQRGEQEYEQLCEELQAVTFEEEEQVIRQATVVGMTTSGAARYHSVLQRVAPRVVVIEEAAEVMEAHIITSLSHNTKHTILIGDHKQLRPKATVYELAQKYNLEVSLFERMVLNNMDCKQLSIQHRMRPEIATLTKRIYDHEIIDHESVWHFPDISGVSHNMFFIDHCQPETLMGGLQSYSNPHEAEFLVALCTYLQLRGYERRQITVLTMYTGQLLVLQERMPREKFQGVKVCAVDNFQGEENDIILLSLVRSNSEGRIGFLGESNRICVALSRARKGFYCIGNFSLLKNQSTLWKEICDDLTTKGAIGDCLELVCKTHNNVTRVRSANDFNRLGGCTMPCGFRLQCGHACDRQCHASSHTEVKCLKKCSSRCNNEHQCQRICHHPNNCPPCSNEMSKTVPKCGHEQPVPCHVDPAKFSCRLKCEKVLQCGHRCDRACGESCTARCQVNCTKTLSCGHKKDIPCYQDPMLHTKCDGKCEKLLDCGHPCSKRCKEQCQCNTEIEITLACEHTKRVLCHTKNNPSQCKEKCSRKLECGHDCTGSCHEDCRMNKCKIDVVKILRCGHEQSVPCYQDPETAFCYAPCPRRLDCGHKCSSVCGRQCHEVQCEESCQIKCDRGHSCQKRCHCGTSCSDCMVEVTMTIPACGHTIKMPCCVDPASLKCRQPCEKERICGHPCPEICSKKCEARPCKVYVSRTLSCDHVVSLPCHKNPDKFICKEKVEVRLTCGHKTLLECHVSKTKLEKVLCTRKVEKELRCKHKLTLPCFKNPEDCPCRKHVNVKLPCGHMKSLVCSAVSGGLQNISCMVKVPRTLPCNHEATLPCRVRSQEYCCQEEVEITLSCGHNKLTACSSKRDELQGGICDRKVTRKLPCGHEKETKCSDKPFTIFCDVPCERFLSCGHLCPNKCGDNCARSKCAVRVKKDLPCGYHKVGCLCADDVSQIICSNQCTQKLMCGHQCPGKCSKKCSLYKCQKIVVKNLNCVGNHSRKMPCSADTSSIACQERCTRNLDCGHPCPGLCSELCAKTKCMRRVEKTYPCGHREQLQCFQSKTATCKARCRRRESCKHMCKGVCGVPCSNYPCDVAVSKTLACGHKITMPCSYSVDEVECSEPCGAKLQCGHQCSGSCNDCQRRGSHEMCQHPCGRPLVCSHRCQATCSTPCPPCIRKCSRRCPHGKCTRLCFESCYPTNNSKQQHTCTKPCTWSCPHYQCNNLCGEECDRPRCDAPCPKKLACRHPCIGLCGENCPMVCATCHAKKLSSMLGGGRAKLTEGLRYLQLFDCGHIVNVEEMDAWMLRELERDVQLIQCPRCSTAITFSYRYGNIIKMTLKNTENVKAQIRQLGNETANFVSGLVRRLRHPSEGIQTTVKKLSRHPNSYALDNVHPIRFPFLFTLKNHLLIMHQIEKALFSLENVTKHQTSLNWQLEVKKHSDTIKDALDKITKYLKKRQLDLRTLDQLHEHTRKFSLFASILEAQSKAIRRQKTLSSIAQTRLKMADKGFRLFLQGNDDALHTDWLERIVDLLRKEVGLEPLQPEEPKEFENFPGFSKGVWKLCEHGQVYFTSWIVCDGEDVNAVSNGCEHCVEREDSD